MGENVIFTHFGSNHVCNRKGEGRREGMREGGREEGEGGKEGAYRAVRMTL